MFPIFFFFFTIFDLFYPPPFTDMKKLFKEKIKHIVACGIILTAFFSVVSFVLTPKAMETEDGANTQESINKVGQVGVLVCAAYIAQHICPDYYSSKLRWVFDTIIPNLLVTLVALMLFPRTINPWYADPSRTEFERSMIALVGPKVVFFLVVRYYLPPSLSLSLSPSLDVIAFSPFICIYKYTISLSSCFAQLTRHTHTHTHTHSYTGVELEHDPLQDSAEINCLRVDQYLWFVS